MSTPADPIAARFAELSTGAAQFCGEVSAEYQKFMATGDVAGWQKYCQDLRALRETTAQ